MRFSIVVPARNESENLQLLIPQLDKALATIGESYEIIVVDNGSTDGTAETLSRLSKEFPALRSVYESTKGFGNAILRGLSESQGDILGYIHADNQMKPDDLVRIYHRLTHDHLVVCKASRLDRHDGITRWIISKSYNFLFRIMFGVRIRDINGSPKLFTKDFFHQADIQSRDWFIDPEIIIKAQRLGLPMAEVEIHTAIRPHGSSQVHTQTVFEFMKNMIIYWRKLR